MISLQHGAEALAKVVGKMEDQKAKYLKGKNKLALSAVEMTESVENPKESINLI